jgi:regulator of replication initiation timing
MINNINIESEQEGDTLMSENNSIDAKLVEHISNENADLKNKVGELTDNVTSLKESNNVLEDENKHLKGELEIKEEVETKLAAFDELGTFEQIKEALEVADKQSNVS